MTSSETRSPSKWSNRIVGHGDMDPEQLLACPNNYRIHTQAQRAALKGAIGDLGFIRSVTITKDGMVVDGHLRVALALSEGQQSIPVEIVDLNEDEVKEALLTLDPLSAMAAADKEKLDELLHDVPAFDLAVSAMLTDVAKNAGLDYGKAKPAKPPEQMIKSEWLIVVTCQDESQQADLLRRFMEEGLPCRALIS